MAEVASSTSFLSIFSFHRLCIHMCTSHHKYFSLSILFLFDYTGATNDGQIRPSVETYTTISALPLQICKLAKASYSIIPPAIGLSNYPYTTVYEYYFLLFTN